ncbi:Flp family type IVb pilin [Chthonobacter albigriseus]|uniref:Flp family type IVb pilin n=1 Tax=Chthonobacter albigriseus TaxID=1683161 RepID=UPI0015EE6927|nr:Flp family type IVb pilin [Chthonobacter albigriseus]
MRQTIKNFIRNESGATAIEYGLIASLIAVVIIGAASTLGSKISNTFSQVSNQLR